MTLVREHYIPLLTGKEGEFRALGALHPGVTSRLTPLIDMPPITPLRPPTPEEPRPPRDTARRKLTRLLKAMARDWGTDRRLMVDLAAYDRYTIGGKHPATWLFPEAERQGLWLMAAVSTDTSVRYQAAIEEVAEAVKGLCLRARVTPGRTAEDVADAVEALANALPSADPAFTYVMLDLGRVQELGEAADDLRERTLACLRALDARGHPASILAGTSFPPAEPILRGQVNRQRRLEWRLWQALSGEPLASRVAFGDYGITGPRSDDDEWRPGPDPHIRYTTRSALLLWRGRLEGRVTDPDDPDGQAVLFPELCRQLVERQDFAGAQFSAGDAAMWDAANVGRRRGNGTKWVEFATNHHLTHVVRALEGS